MKSIDEFVNKVICRSALEVLKSMEAETIDMVLTSPPYWGLRDYGVEGQLGLEKTPEEYIEKMTMIFHEVKRVLKKEGTFWLVIGDSYMGSNQGYGQHGPPTTGFQDVKKGYYAAGEFKRTPLSYKHPTLQTKCLCMIPERLAWSLIQDSWILCNKIIWHKPNPMPSSVKDRFSNTWEYVYLFAKSQRYFFDLDAVRMPNQDSYFGKRGGTLTRKKMQSSMRAKHTKEQLYKYATQGKNPGDHWNINTQPFPEAHFAVFPEKLCEKPIKAGCPEEVCKKCRKMRERIVESESQKDVFPLTNEEVIRERKEEELKEILESNRHKGYTVQDRGYAGIKMLGKYGVKNKKTIGWTSCNCNAGFESGIVLDPFCGAGTALFVAKEMRRRYVGIDIKQEYVDMAKKRLAQGVL